MGSIWLYLKMIDPSCNEGIFFVKKMKHKLYAYVINGWQRKGDMKKRGLKGENGE